MHITSWKDIYKGMENKDYECFLVTPIFDVYLGKIQFKSFLDYMDDLVVNIYSDEKQILSFNTLDAAAIESGRHPFLQNLFLDLEENQITTYYRIKFPKAGISLHFRKI